MAVLVDRFVGFLWTIFAALAIVFALLVAVIRLALPEINQQRVAIEEWLSDVIRRPVHIGTVEASWRGWNPVIDVTELTLLDAQGDTELVRFDSAAIDISLKRSLADLALVPRRLVVAGMRVALERDMDGKISIAGMPPSRWPVAQWILQQENFTLTDATVSFTDLASGSRAVEFTDVVFAVSHEGEHQLIRGHLHRSGMRDEKYSFALHASGDVLSSDWSGRLFVEVTNGDVESALAVAGVPEKHAASGAFHARAWSDWKDAKLRRAAIELDGGAVRLFDSPAEIGVRGIAVRLDDGWSLDLDEVRLKLADSTASRSHFAARWRERPDAETVFAFGADNLRLADLQRLLRASGVLDESMTTALGEAELDGSVIGASGAFVGAADEPKYYVEAAINGLLLGESAQIPRIDGLDFSVKANGHGGILETTHAKGATIASTTMLAGPVQIQDMTGAISWSKSADGLALQTDALRIRAETIDFTTRGRMVFKTDESPFLNIVTYINGGELSRLGALIPLGKLPPRGDAWLRHAFKAGRFAPSRVLFRGKLSDFPFDDGSGSLKGTFELRDVDLQYGTQWPMTTSIDATISLKNRTTETHVHRGQMYSARIDGSTIQMPDLFTRKPVVRIQGKTRVAPDELARFIAESPLSKTKAQRYQDVTITGDFDMTLDMNLGIYPGGEKDVLGLVHFSGNRVRSDKQQITLEDVNGDISFTRQDWYGEGLTATFDGGRVGVVLNGGLDDPNYDTEFRMTGSSDAQHLLEYIDRYAPLLGSLIKRSGNVRSIEGQLPWKAVLTIPETGKAGAVAPKRLLVESSLLGLDVDLPWPFGKTSAEQKPLSIATETDTSGDRLVKVGYGQTVAMEFDQLKQDDGSYTTKRAEFIFGESSPTFTGAPGFHARGTIGRLPLGDWAAFAREATENMRGRESDMPVSFDVAVEDLEAFGRHFKSTRLNGAKGESTWHVAISSPDVIGTIEFPRGTAEPVLTLDFERLWLARVPPRKTPENIDPGTIPSMNLTAGSFHYGDIDLGQASLKTSREEHGLRIEQLALKQSNFELNGTGSWRFEDDVHQSQVTLTVHGKSLAGLLQSFNYAVANIDGGKTSIDITAAWGGMPTQFTLDKLDGQFTLKVDKGRFLDIEPGGGRLFGLLSLQTLPRRLSLDFKDLFSKGLSFDSIEGSFELDRGNAYTNSLLMNGPSARINVAGRTGLSDQDYDQLVTVTPALSNTIPVASALFGPAGIGVGAVIFLGQKMFKSIPEHVDRLLSREYSITGAWKQPVIERI